MLVNRIKELTDLCGVCGAEDLIIDYMYQHFAKLNDDVVVDNIGNVICRLKSNQENAKKLIIFAHMDEIGFIVRKIERNGFIRVERIGGVSTQILPGLKILLHGENGPVKGLIGTPSHHFIKAEDKFRVPQVDELYVDIGARTSEEVKESGIDVGTIASFENDFQIMKNNMISAKALDDRAALGIILEVFDAIHEKQLEWDIYFVAAVMEEFNIRGILPAVKRIKPDAMIGIDVTPSCDTPDMKYNDVSVGKGPAITYMNFHGRGTLAGVLPDRKLVKAIEQVCQEEQIKYQKEVAPGVITENAFTVFENEGIATASISIPTRYTHSPIECINLDDAKNIADLLTSFILKLKSGTQFGKAKENSI